jgi:GNAT superfamily N-acetyltransferase
MRRSGPLCNGLPPAVSRPLIADVKALVNAVVYPMADYASEVPRIASWFFEQWRPLYGDQSLSSVERRIRTWLTRNQIPTALVAISDDGVIGTVALKDRELPDLDYGPWLAGLFVVRHHRCRGIGALLVAAAERQASALGVRHLHLYTPTSEGFYERLGWTVIDRVALPSGTVSVMRKRLEGP